MRGVSLLTAAAESVVVQTPAAVGRTLSSTTAVAAPSQRRSSRPVPPFDVPLTFSVVPAGSTNTSTDGSVTGSLIVVAVTAAPAATGAASSGGDREAEEGTQAGHNSDDRSRFGRCATRLTRSVQFPYPALTRAV